MNRDRLELLVQPFYLEMMRVNAADASDSLLEDVAAAGRTTTSDEVVWLLRSDWRPRVMGAWFAVLHDRSAMEQPVLESLRTCAGSLTAPPLAVAAVDIAGPGCIGSLEAYCAEDLRQAWGSSGIAAAAVEHLGAIPSCQPTDEDRACFGGLLRVVQRVRTD